MAAVKLSGLKLNMVGEFILVKLLNATNKAFYFFFFQRATLQHTTELDQAASVGLTV